MGTNNDDGLMSATEAAGLYGLDTVGGYLRDSLDHGDYPTAALRESLALVQLAERAQVLAVRQARAAGMTWEQIGDLLHVTRSAAHQRFSALM